MTRYVIDAPTLLHGWETTYDAEYLADAKLQAGALVTSFLCTSGKGKGRRSASALEALTVEQD
jgi:hypothetical protein